MSSFTLNVDGTTLTVGGRPLDAPFVRPAGLDLKGPRFGCGLGHCGGCTVIITE